MNKSELESELQTKYREWQQMLDRIGAARMEQTGVAGPWSIKDLVSHLTGWNRRLVNTLRAAVRGEPEPPPPWSTDLTQDDDINAWIYETHRERLLSEVLDESQQVFDELFAVIEELPEEVRIETVERCSRLYRLVWLGDIRYPAGEFFDHWEDDHEPDVRAWLARQGA